MTILLTYVYQIYPSADAVVILNAHTLGLVRVLAFTDAFPGTSHAEKVECVSVDAGMKLVSIPSPTN